MCFLTPVPGEEPPKGTDHVSRDPMKSQQGWGSSTPILALKLCERQSLTPPRNLLLLLISQHLSLSRLHSLAGHGTGLCWCKENSAGTRRTWYDFKKVEAIKEPYLLLLAVPLCLYFGRVPNSTELFSAVIHVSALMPCTVKQLLHPSASLIAVMDNFPSEDPPCLPLPWSTKPCPGWLRN